MKNPVLKFFCIAVLIICFGSSSQAASMGSEIHYVRVDTLTYDVYFIIYRSCNSVSFKMSSSNCKVSNSDGTNTKAILPTLESISDINPICNKVGKPCNPPNTGFTADGVERHIYKITIDFRKSGYDSMYNSGKPVIFTFVECCRNSNITNGAANQNQFNYAYLDLNYGEVSGARFTSLPKRDFTVNYAQYVGLGADGYDPKDSISFGFGELKNSLTGSIKTTAPFKIYDPSGKGSSVPNANPPIGMYFDTKTGDWIFTPTGGGEVPAIVLEMTVWRKISSSGWQKVSVIRRDFTYQVKYGPASSSSPLFTPTFTWNVCEGETVSGDISTYFAKSITDSIYIYILDSIKGSKFQIIDSSHRQKFKFSWTPEVGSARLQPYTFKLKAVDSLCPMVLQSTRTFTVYVKPKPKSTIEVKSLNCNVIKVSSKPTTSPNELTFSWRLLDSAQKTELGTDVVYFPSTNSSKSNLQNDSFYLRKVGKYIVEHKITNRDQCYTVWYDTITTAKSIANLFVASDTILCKEKGFFLRQDLHTDTLFSNYAWSNGDTTKQAKIAFTGNSSKVYLRANAADNGCFYFDDIQVNQAEKPMLLKPLSIQRCGEIDSFVRFTVKNIYSFTPTELYWNQSKTDSIWIGESGIYKMQATNVCGTTIDSVLFVELTIPQINLGSKDTFICAHEDLILNPNVKNKFSSPTFIWSDGSSLSTLTVSKLGTYSVTVTNMCGQRSDTITVSKYVRKPEIEFINETFICNGKAAVIGGPYPDSELLWSTGETSNYITVSKPGKITLEVTNGCGYDIDSVSIVAETSPKVKLPTDTFYCENNPIRLHGGGTNAWYVWSTGEKLRTVFLSKEGSYWVKAENGCGTDSFQFNLGQKLKPKFSLGSDTSLVSTNLILDAGETDGSYLWNTGAETREIKIDKQGLYWAEVTNDCGSFRDSILITFSSIKDLNTNQINVYPNPSNGIFVIKSENGNRNEEVSLIGLDGKILPASVLRLERVDGHNIRCHLTYPLHGMYIIEIRGTSQNIRVPLFFE